MVQLPQTAKDLVGAWTIVSITVEGDGKKSEPFGPTPIGTQIYDSSGRFASILMQSDLPKVASNNRATSTPEESQKIAHGSLAYYGSYTVNEAEKSVTMQMEGAWPMRSTAPAQSDVPELDRNFAQASLRDLWRYPDGHQSDALRRRRSPNGRLEARGPKSDVMPTLLGGQLR